MSVGAFNARGVWAIYKFEMHRFRRTLWTGLAVPVITTSLYFIVFGAAIGSRMTEVNGVPYGSFIVPGLMMLSLFTDFENFSTFKPAAHHEQSVNAMLDQLVPWSNALKRFATRFGTPTWKWATYPVRPTAALERVRGLCRDN